MRRVIAATCLLFATPVWGFAGEKNAAARPSIEVQDGHIDFLADGQLVGRYHIDKNLPRPHFHPVNGPFGKPVTRSYPMVKNVAGEEKDHIHHRALWFCHGEVIPEGSTKHVDFWAESLGHGKIVCVEVGKPQTGSSGQTFIPTRNEWRAADGKKILDETRVLHLVDLGDAKLFVLDIELKASDMGVTFGDTKEGSLGVRVAQPIAERQRPGKKGGVLENAEGKRTEKECWGRKSGWCDYSGMVDEKIVGITVMDHPKNPYPAYWHARGYGLMAANPFGRAKSGFPDARGNKDLVRLAKGEKLKLVYGVLLHAGDAKEGKVAEHYQAFVRLP